MADYFGLCASWALLMNVRSKSACVHVVSDSRRDLLLILLLFDMLCYLGYRQSHVRVCIHRHGMEPAWSESGDRYILKLFRDYLFHQTTDNGQPWIDMGHIVQCLNKVSYISCARASLLIICAEKVSANLLCLRCVYYFLPRRVLSLGGRWCAREDMSDVA